MSGSSSGVAGIAVRAAAIRLMWDPCDGSRSRPGDLNQFGRRSPRGGLRSLLTCSVKISHEEGSSGPKGTDKMKRSRYTEKQMIGSCRSRTPEHQLRSCAAYRARVQRVIQLALHETFRGLEPRFAGKRGRQTATVTVCWRSARQMTGSIRTRHQEYFPAALEAIQSSPFLLAPTVLDSVLPVDPNLSDMQCNSISKAD